MYVEDRHPSTQEKIRWFSYHHLPEGKAQETSRLFSRAAHELLDLVDDGPQLTIALQRLIDAKDAAVRQAIADGEA